MTSVFEFIKRDLAHFTAEQIEKGVVLWFYGECQYSDGVKAVLDKFDIPVTIENTVKIFELLVERDRRKKNGIIFTPEYISDYIAEYALGKIKKWDNSITVVDSGCGCGMFLVSAVKYLHGKFGVPVRQLIENNIFGMDIEPENIRRCRIVMSLLCASYGESDAEKDGLFCADSLCCEWRETLKIERIDFVIGNPPYVNLDNMDRKTNEFLRNTFETTKTGTFNVFYAFIEKAMKSISERGMLGFIVPNNFLTIRSAGLLREFIGNGAFLKRIIDFGHNMVFKPVRTYSCIIFLDRNINEKFEYLVMEKTDDTAGALYSACFQTMSAGKLNKEGWKLINDKVRRNIELIERFPLKLGSFIRTGIATLKDDVYMVGIDERGYFGQADGERIYIESGIVKPVYKIPRIRPDRTLEEIQRYIIFPYEKKDRGYAVIPEDRLKEKYPMAYKYLTMHKTELESRDKGRKNLYGWYAYGRTHGLNRYGKKLLFPSFSDKPKFRYDDNEDALFCNGYAVFSDDERQLRIFEKVLCSSIMEYYIKNTSYAIEGGYYCYQKKYIENFSVPYFSDEEEKFLLSASKDETDSFLRKKYADLDNG